VVLDLRGVDNHYVIVTGDRGQPTVQLAGGQRHDPERERLPRRNPRVHGRQVGPFQGAARRVRVHQQHAVARLGEHVRQPDRGGGLARARLEIGQGEAKTRH